MEGKPPLHGSLEGGGVRLPGERGRAVVWVDGWDITGISDFRMLTEDRDLVIYTVQHTKDFP